MKKMNMVRCIVGIIVLYTTTSLLAAPAPVYEADAMPQQIDSVDHPQADEFIPPPSPDPDNTFVPLTPSSDNSVEPLSSSSQTSSSMQPQPLVPIEGQPPEQLPFQGMQSGAQPTNAIEERLSRIEQQLYTLQDNTQSGDSSPRIDFLLAQVQSLRSQVEQLTQQLTELQSAKRLTEQQVSSSISTSGRIGMTDTVDKKTGIEKPEADKLTADKVKNKSATGATEKVNLTPTSKSTSVPKATPAQPNVAEEQQIYQTAYNLIRVKKYSEAVNTLQSMLKRYPSGQFASNAHYWLGELYGVMGKNSQALNEFSIVVKSYPDSPRVSDAQLKVGLIYTAELKWNEAKLAFKKVINHYPGTTSSRLAAEQIKQIKQSGH